MGLRLVDVVHDDAEVMQLVEDWVHGFTP